MRDDQATLKSALNAWNNAKSGTPSVISDAGLDALAAHFRDDDGIEADVYFKHSSTGPNPEQCGILDAYLLRLSDKGRKVLRAANKPAP